jgi:serine/threonine protein kinase
LPVQEHYSVDDPLIGRQLANFRIERPIGRGGMAQVYYGWDVKLQRPVAIKVIDARFRDNPTYAERFVREAQTIAKWRHEHIIHIYYADDEDGLYYFIMEYIDGQNLGELITHYAAKDELVPYVEVLRMGRAVASALDYAHQRGIIHRDVKPSNVMIARDGRVVLTDFGLALDVQQGSQGEVFGSAHYIAPEQARHSAAAVPQSDLYALGIILYEMLTGAVPFDDPSPTTVAVQHLTLLPPPPRDVNPALNQKTEVVLLKALSKSPQLRFQTGSDLINALEQALQSDSSTSARQFSSPSLPEVPEPVSMESAEHSPLPPPTLGAMPVYPQAKPWEPAVPPTPVVAPLKQRSDNTLFITVAGLSLILVTLCTLVGTFFFLQGGQARNETPSAGQAPTGIIVFTATLPPTSTPTALALPPPTLPTETATATATPETIVLLTPVPTFTPTETPTATSLPTETPTLTPTPTEIPTETPVPTETPLPELPTPTPAASSNYDLLIARRGGDSLFVVNQTADAFPLALLRLGDEAGAINGTEWNLELLDSGACVTVWADEGNPKPPRVTCTEVGQQLTRPKVERFWEKAFNVYYQEQLVGICDKNQCSISIPK